MTLLNFAHPLTPGQLARIAELMGAGPEGWLVRDMAAQADPAQPFGPQAVALADAAGLSSQHWQTEPVLVNLPSYNFLAAALLAELHGRMGYFPPVVRLRPVPGVVPPRFEVAEIINLQALRDEARARRGVNSL